MGQPHLVIKTVAIRDEKSIRLVPMIGACFGFCLAFGVYILGMVGRVVYPDAAMLPGGNAEYVMPMLALTKLPAGLAGLILAGAASAVMSTASALLLVIGSSAGNDLFSQLVPNATDAQKMKVSRYATYVLGLIGAAIPLIILYFAYNSAITYVLSRFNQLSSFMNGLLPVNAVFRVLLPVSVILGVGIALIGSLIAIHKHLKV